VTQAIADDTQGLDYLVVHPYFHHMGVGTKLLAWGVEQAEKVGARMALESTPAGLALYNRFGFKEISVIKADMRQFGYDKSYDQNSAKRVWMIREYQA
jgi:ribosomal protein S18 acetylase RimI-like enzyme